MAQEELLIKINADAKGVAQAYDNIKAKTADLENNLGKLATISGSIFAGLIAEVGLAVKEFGEADTISRQLEATLQNQGIYTEKLADSYREYAAQVQKATGFGDDEIIKAQTVAQQYLGQIPITKELTAAIADLAQQQGVELPQAAEMLGKAIGQGSGQLLRQGLQFSSTSTESERYAKTLEFVQVKAGGMAEQANQGIGAIRGLQSAFADTQEELGKRFAPAVEYVIKGLTNFLTPAKDSNGEMDNLKASLIAAGLAVTGIATALALGGQAFLMIRAAVLAFNISLSATKLAIAGTGIGLLVVALTELYLHWDTVKVKTTQTLGYMGAFIHNFFDGISKVIGGWVSSSPSKMKEGWDQIKSANEEGSKAAAAAIAEQEKKAEKEQVQAKKDLADKINGVTRDQESVRKELAQAQSDAIRLELEDASQEQIDLKKEEIETLKALESEKNEALKGLLRQRLDDVRAMEDEQRSQDSQRQADYDALMVGQREQTDTTLSSGQKKQRAKEESELRAKLMTKEEAQHKSYMLEREEQVKNHNTFLMEQQKFGTAYATISQMMHSQIYQGSKQAFGELAQLTQSSNATLKGIGKAAAVANIIIKTAESAMAIFAGFSTIPIIGPALGMAGAAAAVAFGAEQVGRVTSAATGGVVTGTGYGDKVPYLLEPGELITPRQNFNEVVNSVAQSRGMSGDGEEGGGSVMVELSLKDDLMDFVETKLIERQRIGISISR